MKIAVDGIRGNIGSRLVGMGCEALDYDLLRPETIEKELKRVEPDIIIHAAGISSIQKCEENYDLACSVNTWGTNKLCELAKGKVITLSSEQVFGGTEGFYKEDDEPNPTNNYGLTKLAAEGVTGLYEGKVVRLSRGVDKKSKDVMGYLVDLMMGVDVEVPTFIYRTYSHLDFLAEGILYLAESFKTLPKVVHLAGTENISFFELIDRLSKRFPIKGKVLPRDTENVGLPRPYCSGLNTSLAKSLGTPLYSIEQTVERFVQ